MYFNLWSHEISKKNEDNVASKLLATQFAVWNILFKKIMTFYEEKNKVKNITTRYKSKVTHLGIFMIEYAYKSNT